MQVQNYVWGPAIMTFITAVANVPINMVLIRYYDFWGAALATSVARILLLVLLVGKYVTARLQLQSSQASCFLVIGYDALERAFGSAVRNGVRCCRCTMTSACILLTMCMHMHAPCGAC